MKQRHTSSGRIDIQHLPANDSVPTTMNRVHKLVDNQPKVFICLRFHNSLYISTERRTPPTFVDPTNDAVFREELARSKMNFDTFEGTVLDATFEGPWEEGRVSNWVGR